MSLYFSIYGKHVMPSYSEVDHFDLWIYNSSDITFSLSQNFTVTCYCILSTKLDTY